MVLDIIRLCAALISFIFIGYPFSWLLLVKSANAASELEAYQRYRIIYGRFFLIVVSFYIGSLISGIYLIIISLTGIHYSLFHIIIFSSLFFIYSIILMIRYKRRLFLISGFPYMNIENVFFLNRRGRRKKGPSYEQLVLHKTGISSTFFYFKNKLKNSEEIESTINTLLIVFIIINILVVLFFALLFPVRFWDAVSSWSLKAKAFFIDSTMLDFYTKHGYSFSAVSYPPFLSLIQTWIYLWMGKIDENLVKIIFPIFYSSGIFLVFSFFNKKFNKTISLILAFIFASIPVIADHGYIEYSNMLFSVILFIAVYFFASFISNETAEINTYSEKKRNTIEKVKMYVFERQSLLSFDFKIYDSIESVFKDEYKTETESEISNTQLNRNLGKNKKLSKNILQKNANHPDIKNIVNPLPIRIDRLKKYSHLYLSSIFFGILALTRSEGIFYCVLFLFISLFVYFYRFAKESALKNGFRRVLIHIDESFYNHENYEWWKNISGRFVRSGISSFVNFKLFLKKIFLPVLLLFTIYLPLLLFKLKLALPFVTVEWQKALSSDINFDFLLTGFKRAFSSFLLEFVYSSFDSTKAFFGSFYGPVLLILLILFFAAIKKVFTNGGIVFFLFASLVLASSFVSIIFVPQFEGSIERYILPAFPLGYYWILSSTFKTKL